MDKPSSKDELTLVWEHLPQISSVRILCNINPTKCLSKRRILGKEPISMSIMGNKPITKLIQVFQLMIVFSPYMALQEMEMGVL